MRKYLNKTITIIGLSERTGMAVAEKMIDLGANIIISDIKTADQLKPQLSILKKYDNIEYDLGGHSDKILNTDLIVLSPGVPSNLEIIKRAKEKGIEVISEIELAYRLTEANIIGITGTNGKTTVTSLTGHILKQNLNCKVRIGGNIGSPLITEINGLTKKDWLVVELSSFQLENIKSFHPQISMFLNFSPDHLDRHSSVENYWQAKKRIFENQSKSDIALLNFDDDSIKNKLNKIEPNIFKISSKNVYENGIYYDNESIYYLNNGNREKIIYSKDIPLIGTHNILNTSFAVLLAKLFEIKNKDIKKSVINYKAFSHRLEVIYDEEYTVIDDSKATNPHAAINAMRSLKTPLITIVGGQDRNANFTDLAYTIRERCKKAVILGETKNEIKSELEKVGFKNYIVVDNMREAVQEAFKKIKINDTILLSPGCPSWDMYESYKKRGLDFQKEVKKYLK